MCKALEDLKEEGRQEGIKEGKAEGIKEAEEKHIKSMYNNGADIDTISKLLNMDINYKAGFKQIIWEKSHFIFLLVNSN